MLDQEKEGNALDGMEDLTNSWLLDGRGGGSKIQWSEVSDANLKADQWLWIHLDYSKLIVQQWMYEQSDLSDLTVEALLQAETRPRSVPADQGVMVFLRGVNLNPGANPEDMVSLRLWIGERRIYTLGLRRLISLDDMRESILQDSGPESPGDFVVRLVDLLLNRAATVIEDLYDKVDELEDSVLLKANHQQRVELAMIRRQAIALRRFLAPQREALNRLSVERNPVFSEQHHLQLREHFDRLTRFVEDLDAARERAGVIQESVISNLAEQTNNRMYILSVISVIFLPLSFVTGLLGINVGGIPGAENPLGFPLVVAGMILVAVAIWLFLRWRRWF